MRTQLRLLSTLVFLLGSTAQADLPEGLEPFLDQHCYDCHDSESAEGDLDLTALGFDLSQPAKFSHWLSVMDRVEAGEMPPKKKKRPETAEQAAFLKILRGHLTASAAEQSKGGRAELRRLSRVEYANSLKDLLDLPHLEVEDMLPPDSLAHGFTKSSQALDFSHVMIARYLEVVDHALWQAVAKRPRALQTKTIRSELKSVEGVRDTLQTLQVQLKHGTAIPLVGKEIDTTIETHRGDFAKRQPGYVKDLPPHFDGVATFMNSRDNHNIVMKPFRVHQSGYYKLRVNGWGLLNDHGKLLPSERHETVSLYTPTGRLLGRCDLPPNVPTTSEATVWLNEGEPIEFLASSTPNKHFKITQKEPFRFYHFRSHGIGLRWFEMEGPIWEQWPPRSHQRLLGDLELKPTKDQQPNGLYYEVVSEKPLDDARQLLRAFATRALRRPFQASDLKVPMQQTRARLNRGEPFVDAIMAGYRAILTSPEFLLVEEKPGALDAWALATRLALFLTNSPPDVELRRAAADGSLVKDAELRRETARLLEHGKSARVVAHVLEQWLDLRKITLTEPDLNLYPEYNPLLAESMVDETRAFFAEMLRSDLGAMHVIDSDFLTINQRMAKLYGIEGVHGSQTRKISIPGDSVRGGLLTQGSLLKITANGTTTSPVVRGTFTLERLLGDPPPPPPAAVPGIEPDISGAITVREQLAKHRADPNCASCHAKIDPPGFALESFDVMGAFRTNYRATLERGGKTDVKEQFNAKPAQFRHALPVDSSGTLPDGAAFKDVNEFRDRLRAKDAEIARHLLEQLIVYSTGAPVGFRDRSTVDAMMEELKTDDYGARSMIHAIVQSELFRHK